MAQIYTTNISSLDEDSVLDSNFYDPTKLKFLKGLSKNNIKLNNKFEEIRDLTSTQNKLKLPATLYDLPDSLGNLFNDGKIINEASDIGSTKKIAKNDDFAISRLRHYLLEFGILNKEDCTSFLLSTEYIILRRTNKLSEKILIPYFLTKQIQYIFEKSQRGSNHPRLASKDILNLGLPKKIIDTKDRITEKVENSIRLYNSAKILYPQAEKELLQVIEWQKVNTKHNLNYQRNSKDIIKNERLDAEFFQPKFENLIKHLKNFKSMRLGDFCEMPNRGVQPEYIENGEILVINSKHLGPTEIDIENAEKTSQSFIEQETSKKALLKQFDVLVYSTGAYVGRTNCYLENKKGIASNHVTIIRPDPKICNPVYLALFLNSLAGVMQTDQRASGSAQREIYPQEIVEYQIFIPINKQGKPDMDFQNRLAEKIIKANNAKKEAKLKLKEGKEIVEKEIEKSINKK